MAKKNDSDKEKETNSENINLEDLEKAFNEEFEKAEVEEVKLTDSEEIASLKDALSRERADFLNYKTRSNKEIEKSRAFGKQDSARAFIQVMDEIDRAKEHGDIQEGTPFEKVTAKLEEAFSNLGFVKYATKGDEFDPKIHDALMNREAKDDEKIKSGVTLVDQVVEAGYKLNDEVFRTAKVTTVSKG